MSIRFSDHCYSCATQYLYMLGKSLTYVINRTETEYVSQILTKIKRFAQHHSCHVWFVAHPRQVIKLYIISLQSWSENEILFGVHVLCQLHNWNGGPPNMYDISGSAHFINKCDNGIVIHRNRDKNAGPLDVVQVTFAYPLI